jgi:hypothetical protein
MSIDYSIKLVAKIVGKFTEKQLGVKLCKVLLLQKA